MRALCSIATLALAGAPLSLGCRAPLPGPQAPLTPSPAAEFRARPPAARAPTPPKLSVFTATRADGLRVFAVDRPHAAVTSFGWTSPSTALVYPHPAGLLDVAARAQVARLGSLPGPTHVSARVGLRGVSLIAEVSPAHAEGAAAAFAAIVGSAPDDRSIRRAERDLEHALRREAFGSRRVADRVHWAGLFGPEHSLALAPKDLARRADGYRRADLLEVWAPRALAGPRRVVVVGPDAQALARRILEELPEGAPEVELLAPSSLVPQEGLRIRVVPRYTNPWIEMVFPARAAAPGDVAPRLAAEVLGGALRGRLADALRLDSGHSYALASRYDAAPGLGLLRIAGNVGPDDVPLFIERVVAAVRSLREGPVTAEEVEAARAALVGDLLRAASTSRGLAWWLLEHGPADIEAASARAAETPGAEISRWAREAMPEGAAHAVVFAAEQSVFPLMTMGDAVQLRLEPF